MPSPARPTHAVGQ